MNASGTETTFSQQTTLEAGSDPNSLHWGELKASKIEEAFKQYAKDGLLPMENLKDALGQLNIFPPHQELDRLKCACATNDDFMTLDET